MPSHAPTLRGKLVVIGQGYVGLPLAVRAAQVGWDVIGLDTDRRRTESLSRGDSFIEDVTSADIAAAIKMGRYAVSDDYATARGFDVAVLTVPTPLRDGTPDLTFIQHAANAIAPLLRPGSLVILESTTYPGTTEELVAPILEQGSNLICGDDFYLGYSPERIDPGNTKWGLVNTPKVVSGVNPESLKHVQRFYESVVDRTVPVSTPKEAELTKLLENTFRHVNIALVNELAIFARALGINLWEAIDAASTKPFGFMAFTPGPGVGGHCLPIDPSYLSWQVKRTLGHPFRFVELANDVNDHMPDYVVRRAIESLNSRKRSVNGSRLLLLGLAYKKDSSDARQSPAVKVAELLASLGGNVRACDPHVEADFLSDLVARTDLTSEEVKNADLTIVLTDHTCFDFDSLNELANGRILDCRRVAALSNAELL